MSENNKKQEMLLYGETGPGQGISQIHGSQMSGVARHEGIRWRDA